MKNFENNFLYGFIGAVVLTVFEIIIVMTFKYSGSDSIKVGDCVRELGRDYTETVTVVTNKEVVETLRYKVYSWGETEKELSVYSPIESIKLIKVNCP